MNDEKCLFVCVSRKMITSLKGTELSTVGTKQDIENTPKCIGFICILASRSCPPGLAGFGLVIMMTIMMRRRIVSFTWAGVGAAQKGVGRGRGQSTDPDRRNSSGGGSDTTTTLVTLRLQER